MAIYCYETVAACVCVIYYYDWPVFTMRTMRRQDNSDTPPILKTLVIHSPPRQPTHHVSCLPSLAPYLFVRFRQNSLN